MLWLISYDVSEDDRRRRIFEALKDYGRRVQFSVFECELDEAELALLWRRLEPSVDPATDSVRCYRLCGACAGAVQILGRGDRYSEPPFIVV